MKCQFCDKGIGTILAPTMKLPGPMKKLTFLLLIIFAVQCRNPQNTELTEPIFNASLLSELALDSLPAFWGNDSVYSTDLGAVFSSQDGYKDALGFKSNNGRWLSLIVFTSRPAAIVAMEFRINNVAAVFKKGDSTSGKTWWYSDSSASGVILSLSKYNTIVEAVRAGTTFLFENDSLWIPINEISNRIDSQVK
jgi:hypothetical protein